MALRTSFRLQPLPFPADKDEGSTSTLFAAILAAWPSRAAILAAPYLGIGSIVWGLLVRQVLTGAIQNSPQQPGQLRDFPAMTIQFGLLLQHDAIEFLELTLLESEFFLKSDQGSGVRDP